MYIHSTNHITTGHPLSTALAHSTNGTGNGTVNSNAVNGGDGAASLISSPSVQSAPFFLQRFHSGGSYHVCEEDEYSLHRLGGGHVITVNNPTVPSRTFGLSTGGGEQLIVSSAPTDHRRSFGSSGAFHLPTSSSTMANSTPSLAFSDDIPEVQSKTTCPANDKQQTPEVEADDSYLDPLNRFLGQHPQYQDPFNRLHYFLLRGDGPLPYTVRHYIAIMAAARHHCKYLVNEQKNEFRQVGGDEAWLQGIEHVPTKIQNLNEINKILAHQPWLLTKEHIERLTKGDDNWSLSELVQAIVLLAHFHSLCSFVFGCGFNDLDDPNISTGQSPPANSNNLADLLHGPTLSSAPPSPPSPPQAVTTVPVNITQSPNGNNSLDLLMWKMRSISEAKSNFELESQEELVKNQSLEIVLAGEKNASTSTQVPVQTTITQPSASSVVSTLDAASDHSIEIERFVKDRKFTYVDFARQRAVADITTFRVQDYSWSDHAYSLVNRLYLDVGGMLDEKFSITYNLTYYTMGRKTNVDTSVFRRAIWNYIQCMYGIRHDDYDYHEVNELLERNFKTYIKTVCCFPHQTRRRDADLVMREFRRSEKVHVNLMIMEARLQAELLYALRTIMRHMT